MTGIFDRIRIDEIMFRHICPGRIEYDANCNRYAFECRLDDRTFEKIKRETAASGYPFDEDSYNSFVACIRGLCEESRIICSRDLPEKLVLSGEILLFNSGTADEIGLLKLSRGKYMIVRHSDAAKLLIICRCDENSMFGSGAETYINPIGKVVVKRLHLLPPSRIARAYDRTLGNYRFDEADDISEEIGMTLRLLGDGELENEFKTISRRIALKGVSSWILRILSDAFLRKYPGS